MKIGSKREDVITIDQSNEIGIRHNPDGELELSVA
jgi:hypothetical protein